MSAAWRLLANTNVEQYITERRKLDPARRADVVTIDASECISEALRLFSENGILSAPVIVEPGLDDCIGHGFSYEAEGSGGTHYTVVNWLSCADLVRAFTSEVFRKSGDGMDCIDDGGEIRLFPPTYSVIDALTKLSQTGAEFSDRKVISIGSDGDRDMLYRDAQLSASLADIVGKSLLRPRSRGTPAQPEAATYYVHRVGIFNAHGEVQDIISMSDIITFLNDRVDELGDLKNKTVAELGLATLSLCLVDAGLPTIDCFRKMELQACSAVGVIDGESQALIGTLSESDVRGITPEQFGLLALPVSEWLLHKRGLPPPVHRTCCATLAFSRQLLTCTSKSTLKSILSDTVENGVHRIWLVEQGSDIPSGVITLTDIVRVLCGEAAFVTAVL